MLHLYSHCPKGGHLSCFKGASVVLIMFQFCSWVEGTEKFNPLVSFSMSETVKLILLDQPNFQALPFSSKADGISGSG